MSIFIFLKDFFSLLAVLYTIQLSEVYYFIFNAINKFINYNTTFGPKIFLKICKNQKPKKNFDACINFKSVRIPQL
jgi:hypothetical protein